MTRGACFWRRRHPGGPAAGHHAVPARQQGGQRDALQVRPGPAGPAAAAEPVRGDHQLPHPALAHRGGGAPTQI